MALQSPPVAKTQMLVRRPAAEVFAAFVDPDVTTKFWFTRSSGRLEPGKDLTWHWDMYGVSAPVSVKAVEPDERILVEWGEPPTPAEWTFSPRGDGATLVSIRSWGFHGSDDEAVAKALDSAKGFTFVLAGLKAWLEHGLALNLVADHNPDAQK